MQQAQEFKAVPNQSNLKVHTLCSPLSTDNKNLSRVAAQGSSGGTGFQDQTETILMIERIALSRPLGFKACELQLTHSKISRAH
jgi:hypothetical protein